MQAPDRLTVPTCIGCGAMGGLGTCETGCVEQRLDLIRAVAYEVLGAAGDAARARAEAFHGVAQRLACEQPARGRHEIAYRSVQAAARAALRRHRDPGQQDLEESAEPATTWWCERCGAIDAPQPCLGICIWRPIEWVSRTLYEHQHELTLAELEREQQLRLLLRHIAFVTPHADRWERSWQALQAEARATLTPRAVPT